MVIRTFIKPFICFFFCKRNEFSNSYNCRITDYHREYASYENNINNYKPPYVSGVVVVSV